MTEKRNEDKLLLLNIVNEDQLDRMTKMTADSAPYLTKIS